MVAPMTHDSTNWKDAMTSSRYMTLLPARGTQHVTFGTHRPRTVHPLTERTHAISADTSSTTSPC